MKFRIKDFGEEVTELFLEECDEGNIDLIAVDIHGEYWHLLSIQSDGTLFLYEALEASSGFKTNEKGCLLIGEELP